jgi:multiple sugar transport system permease protein
MNAFLWLIGIIGLIIATIYAAGATIAAIRAKNIGVVLTAAAALIALIGVTFGVRFAPLTIVLSIVVWFGSVRLLKSVTRNANHAAQVVRLSGAHLALLFGSFVFMIPFAWLISTSLKADDEQAVFPPVWIPTQQVLSTTVTGEDGKPARLSKLTSGAEVLEVADLPSGEVKIRPIAGGTEQVVKRTELTKIRHIAPRWENYY